MTQTCDGWLIALLLPLAALGVAGGAAAPANAVPQWWKADTHVHSVFSADALPDVGVLSKGARERGYNAIFLSDHGWAATSPSAP